MGRLSRGGLLQTLSSVQLLPKYLIFKRMNYVMSSSSYRQDWCNLPDVILGDIMMMVGLESLDTLHTCRQVRRSWNEMICEIMVTQKFRKNVVKRIRIKWTDDKYRPSNAEISAISQAKFLVKSGHLQTDLIEKWITPIEGRVALIKFKWA